MSYLKSFLVSFFVLVVSISNAHAFCGFYVAKADTNLFNNASKVVMTRNDDRTVITMANDFQGDAKDFAIVIPVPTLITRNQVNVAESKIIDHLDAYTAPRLVEYFDNDPCQTMYRMEMMAAMDNAMPMAVGSAMQQKAASLGVTIEDEYSVGEYDIIILSAEQSDGLFTFLNSEGYKLPEGAQQILGSYIKQNMKFFLAKVNVEEFESEGFTYLRPLQVAFESNKFMLPIRLGTLNANGPQDLILMTITKNGRVEPVNYRTVKIPSNINIPVYVENEFDDFYRDMFSKSVEKENMKAVFLEYAWNMSWCDPCAADPLSNDELRTLGAWWIDDPKPQPSPVPGRPQFMPTPQIGGPVQAYVTRLHVRYTGETFPEDLVLQETEDTENFQGRYILQKPWTGDATCDAATSYYQSLPARFEEEAKTLANITGWDIADIRADMEENGQTFKSTAPPSDARPWWERMWNKK